MRPNCRLRHIDSSPWRRVVNDGGKDESSTGDDVKRTVTKRRGLPRILIKIDLPLSLRHSPQHSLTSYRHHLELQVHNE